MRTFAAALIAATMLTAPAMAWTARTGGSGPQAIGQDGGSASAAQANARATAVQGQAQHQGQRQSQTATGGAGGQGGAGGRGGNARATGGSSRASTGAITNTNNLIPGGGGGYNDNGLVAGAYASDLPAGPCTGVGTTAGITVPFFSGSGAHAEPDQVCQLHMIGRDGAAKEFLCRTNKDIRIAFQKAGDPCVDDAPKSHLVLDTKDSPPDWCGTANAGERLQHYECNTVRRVP